MDDFVTMQTTVSNKIPFKRVRLTNKREAALAYNIAAKEIFGAYASLNRI